MKLFYRIDFNGMALFFFFWLQNQIILIASAEHRAPYKATPILVASNSTFK